MKKFLSYVFGSLGVLTIASALASSPQEIGVPTEVLSEPVYLQEEEVAEAFINVDTSSGAILGSNGAYYVTGSTSENCSTITVTASNSTAGINDVYELTDYSYGDSDFYYGIRSDWENLGDGINTYSFVASCDGGQTETASFTKSYTSYTAPTYTLPTYTAPSTIYDSDVDYYINVDGNSVQSPTYYESAPASASAKCKDGTYSFSQHRQGTCSGHGGVAQWL